MLFLNHVTDYLHISIFIYKLMASEQIIVALESPDVKHQLNKQKMFQTQFDKETKLWRGRDLLPVFNPKISLAQVILRACINNGPKIAQVTIKLRSNHSFKIRKELLFKKK